MQVMLAKETLMGCDFAETHEMFFSFSKHIHAQRFRIKILYPTGTYDLIVYI